jgi:aerobic carbon-monoxide dehydrogenase large subunit
VLEAWKTEVEDLPDPESLITGHGTFVDDLHLERMLHLKIVRSTFARAKILKLEGGITGSEFKANLSAVGEGAWGGERVSVPYPALASDYVSYVGQPVAAVLADDQYKAEDMMEEVNVDYDALKPLVDPEDAFTFEPIHPATKSNIVSKVELGHDFQSDAQLVLEDELVNERIAANPIEPRALVARYDGSKLIVWASTQSVHTWKEGIVGITKLPRELVRVIQMNTGGAFGTKSGLYPEYAIACYASMKTRRPVKWIETRSEHLLATSHGRGARGRIKVFADRQGHVSGLKADVLVDNGAFAMGIGAFAPRWIGYQISGPYAIDKIFVTGASVFTNKVPLGPYRGAGRPEAAFLYERMMDLIADELHLDPVEVRLRNASAKPFVSPLGLKIDPFEPFLKSAVDELGYSKLSKRETDVGFSSFILVSSVQPGESARISVSREKVKVWMGGSQSGQDHETIAQKLVSEELGISPSVIKLEHGDTEQLDQGIGTWGSRTAVVGGAALIEAARKLREQARTKLGNYTQDELLKHEFDVTVFHQEKDSVISFGANLAKVLVDKETGMASVDECAAYYDAGRVLNPFMVESQSIGGTAQGIGQVLYEEAKYNKDDGQLIAGTIEDAGVPTASLIPNITIKLARHPSKPGEPIKGIGEAPTVGVPPAVIRALERNFKKRLRRTPLHPEAILALTKV